MANTCSLMPSPKMQFFDNDGLPLAGGKVYTYAVGTSTPKAAYADSAGGTALSNPVILDSAGRATIYLDGSYKIIITDSADVILVTQDNVSSQYYISPAPAISSGNGAPASTPTKVGDIYCDTVGGKVYAATNTANSAGWKILN